MPHHLADGRRFLALLQCRCDRVVKLEAAFIATQVVIRHVDLNARDELLRTIVPDIGREMIGLKEIEHLLTHTPPDLGMVKLAAQVAHDREDQFGFFVC